MVYGAGRRRKPCISWWIEDGGGNSEDEDDDDGMYAGYSGSEGLLDVEAASGALSFLVGVE